MSDFIPQGLPYLLQPTVLFQVLFGLLALGSALAVVTRRNPVAAVAWLVVHFVATAALYLLMNAQFLAMVQVLVYAGAIIVLFLFVIMLLQVDQQPSLGAESGAGRKVLVIAASLAFVGLFISMASCACRMGFDIPSSGVPASTRDTIQWLVRPLFEEHLVAFELSSILLVAAMAGVLVFTTRRQAVTAEPGDA
ncbi:MAG: NADH-quinone oxidoreductase subunit J [Acidobacteriota bacterium]